MDDLAVLGELIKKFLDIDLDNPNNWDDFKRQNKLKELCVVRLPFKTFIEKILGKDSILKKDEDNNFNILSNNEVCLATLKKEDYDYDKKDFNIYDLNVTLSLKDYFDKSLKNSNLGGLTNINSLFVKKILEKLPIFFDKDKIKNELLSILQSILDEKYNKYISLNKNIYIVDFYIGSGNTPGSVEHIIERHLWTQEEYKKYFVPLYSGVAIKKTTVIRPVELGMYEGKDDSLFKLRIKLDNIENIEKINSEKKEEFNLKKNAFLEELSSIDMNHCEKPEWYILKNDEECKDYSVDISYRTLIEYIKDLFEGKKVESIEKFKQELKKEINKMKYYMTLEATYFHLDDEVDKLYFEKIRLILHVFEKNLPFIKQVKKGFYNLEEIDTKSQYRYSKVIESSTDNEWIWMHRLFLEKTKEDLLNTFKKIKTIKEIYLISKISKDDFSGLDEIISFYNSLFLNSSDEVKKLLKIL